VKDAAGDTCRILLSLCTSMIYKLKLSLCACRVNPDLIDFLSVNAKKPVNGEHICFGINSSAVSGLVFTRRTSAEGGGLSGRLNSVTLSENSIRQ
jgi:hypothetical protein